MNTGLRIFAASLTVIAAVFFFTPAAVAKKSTTEKVIVTVNGTPITQAEINADIEKKLAGAAGKMPPERLAQIKAQMQEKALDNYITKTVLGMECDKQKITASQQEIDAALKEVRKGLPDGMSLDDALKTGGITLESLTKDITFTLRVNKLIEANVEMPPPTTEADLKAFYEGNQKSFEVPESVKARHILIKSDKNDDAKTRDEKKKKAEDLRKQLKDGADFADIASKNSDCPSKKMGGDLGSFGRGRMAKPFEEAAFSQQVDEIGPVVETRFGFHIIQVQEHKQAEKKTFEESKEQINKYLEQQNKNTRVRAYIDGLKDKAEIVYEEA
jgi:peptidyl-prolyl cis-trans isomerase C